MPAHRISFSWSPKAQGGRSDATAGLAERLRPCALDRAASAREVALEAAQELTTWIGQQPREWGSRDADRLACGAELETGWSEWLRHQGWRGAGALLIDALRIAFATDEAGQGHGPREALLAELGAWTGEETSAARASDDRPTVVGRRTTDPEALVPHALRELERRDHVLVYGGSETVLAALCGAQQAGLYPQVTVAAGAPDHSGKRMARHLANHGLAVRLVWDAAALGAVAEADRIWIGTEAVGSGEFLALVGSRLLADEAARLEVPMSVLCTDEVCVPGGELRLPAWADDEGWGLWSQGPEGVELDSQPYERVPGGAVNTWITCEGHESLAQLCTRSLRLEPAPPCGPAHVTA